MNGHRTLVVMASQTQGLLLKLLLEERGVDTTCVEGVEPALSEMARVSYDLLIVEGDLAGTTGLAELRARSSASVMVIGRGEGEHDSSDPQGLVAQAVALLERRTAPPSAADIFRRARILIVDDSATYREFLRAELEQEGCAVTAARNADEAVTALAGGGLDCVILDLVMPGTSGTQLCQRFDRFRRQRGLFFQIVILTSQDDEDQLMISLNAGADDFVGKAQTMDVLKVRLMALLRRKYFVEDHLLRLSRLAPSA
ncbi:response regulator transcription factor [Azospirillum picis]|uniref:DNA-binding response OmpR family regulator n=1 Tax=Azospirillum picis TaxID=488438 RepID=A0ABU0MHM2_9PROT|nr:response regulator [Azospirillum picis]MBP2298940.1 DNA-binding response OmpR family regulator [Azospirillum picis]MDQ0532818.1 DNA-binding response OmpR family regulator [Azospirillum picis]